MDREKDARLRGRTYILAVLALLSLVAAACGGGTNASGDTTTDGGATTPDESPTEAETTDAPQEVETIRIAGAAIVPRAGIDIAIERGYFADENLEIEIVELQSGADQIPLLASGQVDATITGPAAGHYNALSAGIPVRFVAPCGSSSADGEIPNLILSVRKELFDSGAVTSVEDLGNVEKFGIPNLESKGYVDALQYLEMAGITTDDIELVQPLSFPDTSAGLEAGAIDAGLLVEPFAALGEIKGTSVVIGGDHLIMPLRLGCSLVYGSRLIENPDLGDRFMRAYLRAARDYHDAFFNDEGKAEIVELFTGIYPVDDPAMYDQMIPNYIDPNGRLNEESLLLDIGVFVDEGFLPEAPDLADIIDTGFAQRAVEELGEFETG